MNIVFAGNMINVMGNAEAVVIYDGPRKYVLKGHWEGQKFICTQNPLYNSRVRKYIREMSNLHVDIEFSDNEGKEK